ncbi:RraA family protein [Flavilitoribacter nigricans]|uniref:Dimethylmenaquinone methyltransferase n=1 Tax=Flavilitoribacter nigricans (strain ATCC 23147 / DSM 23189 / NBRC 102662 / NCIMB 1420 / SS-2) TaxID=1122177 RepID=A0A2D0NAI7_FLAN2|nr:dimethylmenaquinone methyltransferase [Flavilitoribacter nigricans]PHN05531.1 dimethylmenaquinone methyltransferase [Flavilitoribacter nigricans DSM 23189 = NBRC 102662]
MKYLPLLITIFAFYTLQAQVPDRKTMEFYTQEYSGERFDDGRPKVPDNLLQRMEKVSIEEAWGTLRNKGFHNQFAGEWEILHPDQVMVGRALTVQYMPNRPDFSQRMLEKGHAEGQVGAMNSWPIDMLQKGDIYVADGYGKIVDGTLIGDNLGNAIYAKSGKGVVFNASSRDLEGLERIDGFNAWVKGWDPSFLRESMVTGINTPIRIGTATVFPGDVVLAKKEGVIFIPAHLVEEVVINAEFIMLRDEFGIMRLKEGKYTPGEIDTRWTEAIKTDFLGWLDANPDKLPMTRAELDAYLKERNW